MYIFSLLFGFSETVCREDIFCLSALANSSFANNPSPALAGAANTRFRFQIPHSSFLIPN